MRCDDVRPDGQQAILLVSNDALLCAALRRDLESRRPNVRVAAVSSVEAALQIVEKSGISAILLAEEFPDLAHDEKFLQLDTVVNALRAYAPVVVVGRTEREPRLDALIAAGAVDYISRGDGFIAAALDLLERRLGRSEVGADGAERFAEDWPRDFAEVLRHELNNPLTGILGNAELLLAEITRKNDGRLPHGGLERVETIAALAMRMRETVRQLSQEWEARSDTVRS
jgi:signal transduction histidine kinase